MGQKSQVVIVESNLNGSSDGVRFAGGRAACRLTSSDSRTMTLDVSFNNGVSYIAVTDITGDAVSTTTDAFFNVELPNDSLVRITTSGGAATTASLYIAQTHSLV